MKERTMSRRSNGEGTSRQKADGRWKALYYVNDERQYLTGRKHRVIAVNSACSIT